MKVLSSNKKDYQIQVIDDDEDSYRITNTSAYNDLVIQQVNALLLKKTKIIREFGIWPWNKVARKKHREINTKLEALGVYQGKIRS